MEVAAVTVVVAAAVAVAVEVAAVAGDLQDAADIHLVAEDRVPAAAIASVIKEARVPHPAIEFAGNIITDIIILYGLLTLIDLYQGLAQSFSLAQLQQV